MPLWAGVLLIVLFVLVCSRLIRRGWRGFRADKSDRPATLEGGGSHLTTARKGK